MTTLDPFVAIEDSYAGTSRQGIRVTGPSSVHVLRVIARLNIGGPARHALVLGRGLEVHGMTSLLAHGEVSPGEGTLESLLDVAQVPMRRIGSLGARVRPWRDAVAFAALVRLMFRERPDVVHTHTAKAGALGRIAAAVYNATQPRARRAAVVHTFHGHVLEGYFGSSTTRAIRIGERALARLTDRVVALSANQEQDLCDRHQIAPRSKMAVVELGFDLDSLLAVGHDDRLRRAWGIGANHIVFGWVGRFVPIKDLPTLVRAFGRVRARLPESILMLVGDGPERPAIETMIRERGLESSVCLTGWQQEMAAVYGAIDVGVLSSRNEGTPVALIEAMAAGRPVVATDAGGVCDVVAHERTGLVVPQRDPAALADAMLRLALDGEWRTRLGAEARRQVAHRYAAGRLAQDLSRLYRLALAERRADRVAHEGAAVHH